ncbi:MAG: 16S rRNA (guanine(527)-N(7))-methyltransferase RsmG [Bacilli bacterium]|nr:16S rRNA (guanine(527)-N(7))-methyltransferase RsmG [Bacilli bacterium]
MNKATFLSELDRRGISCSIEQVNLLWEFMHHVLETNEKFNLTAIKDEDAFVEKMLFDSALFLNNQNYANQDIVDIGAGAGFPSVVLSILSPNIHVIALDSTAKKIDFINSFAKEHNLNVEGLAVRAEDFARENRNKFLLVTARAVAPLRVLIELAMPMLQVGGHLIAFKGPDFEKEIKEAQGAFKKLNCDIHYIYEDQLPESGESRYFIYVRKLCNTPNKYPRTFGEIKNKPL